MRPRFTTHVLQGATALLLLPGSYCSSSPSDGALVFTASRNASVRFSLSRTVTVSFARGGLTVAGTYGGLYLEPAGGPKGSGVGILDVPAISRHMAPDRFLFGAIPPSATSVRLAKGSYVAHVLGDRAVTVEIRASELDGVRRFRATAPSRVTAAVRDVRAAVPANVTTAPVNVPANSLVLVAANLVRDARPVADVWQLDTCLRADPVPACVAASGGRRWTWHDATGGTNPKRVEEGVVVEFGVKDLPAGQRTAVATFATTGEVVDARTVVFVFTP